MRSTSRNTPSLIAPLLAAALLAACGGAPPPPAAAPSAAPAPDAAAEGAAPDEAASGGDSEAAERCLATANAKRAKFSGEPAKITVKHVLIKYKDAKNADEKITRSRGEACLRALEALEKLKQSGDFNAVVSEFSEEPGAASRGGSVGTISRPDVAKNFADAAFELSLQQVSDVVETEFGFHIIMRTE